jgi:hypothetical protein
MGVRVRYSLAASVSSTTAEERDLGNVRWEIVTDQEAKGGTWKTLLPAVSVDVQLQIDNISTIQLLIIRTNAKDPNQAPNAITIKRNSTLAEAIIIKPLGDALEGHFIISTDSLTSIYASNAGPTDMEVTIVAAGT